MPPEMRRQAAPNRARTAFQDPDDFPDFPEFSDGASLGDLSTSGKKSSPQVQPSNPTGKTSSKPNLDKMKMSTDAMGHMANLLANVPDDEDEINDNLGTPGATSRPEPATPENLPATISRMMTMKNSNASKNSNMEPRFFMVKDLPGYLQGPIRQLGKSIFSAFTTVPLDKINVCANLGGQGPCTSHELNVMTGWLKRNAVKRDEAVLDFSKIMPGYDANCILYDAEDFSFLVVKDDMGDYIYSWPQKNSISLAQAQRKLLGETSSGVFHYWTKLLIG
jgi:hypothetical protein